MPRIQLFFRGVSEILGTDNLGLLILSDEEKERQISIVCDRAMAVQIELRMKKVPIAEIMLPEVLCKIIKMQDLQLELVIDDLVDGQYRTILYNAESIIPLLIRASDAVLLSIVGDIPLYIDYNLMKRQSVRYSISSRGVSLPVNTISDEMLQSALNKAIEDENYELASHLRDELKRRDKHNDKALD
ncbi:MAG: DUF151 domain-containing protein [Prevotella sp.]|nr:DUF151 domain-containing protein [Prevotella sp.]